jgi:hypothetical protein
MPHPSLSTRPTTRLFSASFTPPTPPGTQGTPVFHDIDLEKVSPEAGNRNKDPNAVFLVTGANRGIGLQFVKALASKTQVRVVTHAISRRD